VLGNWRRRRSRILDVAGLARGLTRRSMKRWSGLDLSALGRAVLSAACFTHAVTYSSQRHSRGRPLL
jgi:hypothetical protein